MTALILNGVKVLSSIGLVLSLSLFDINVYADEYAYKPSGKYVVQPLKHGEKWQTDEVLRTGMDSIRETITVSQDDVLKERLVASEYLRLANEIDKNIAYIIKNFKLTADAERAFRNVVLVDLSEGTGLMRSSKDIQVQRLGALGVLQTLRNYGKYFQHAGWHYE
jgi:hypothetical protein